MRACVLCVWIAICVFASCAIVANAEVTLTIDAGKPSHPISPRLVGIFFEDINFGADGGLNAELVKNGSFEFPERLMGWSIGSPDQGQAGGAEVTSDEPAQPTNPHFVRIAIANPVQELSITNEGFRGIGVRAGDRYLFSTSIRGDGPRPLGGRVALVSENGGTLASASIPEIGSEWTTRTVVLTPNQTATNARLVATFEGEGTADLDNVSLYPEKTWKGRPHGLRADIVQALADLKPAFVRFPGGCIVEGSRLEDRYQWKETIGERTERPLNFNRWNTVFRHRPAPDYYQSYGLGFFEFFQLAEDIGAEPMPIVNCGMACQFQSSELVPLDELQPYVQDALDLIEFANGPPTSVWGARRAAMGHPEPFGMKLLGVGNEQWGPDYFERYQIFARALKEKHPEIELVSSSGPFPSDRHFQYAWPRLRELKVDHVDEHCYAMPDWFLRSATRYDSYDRNDPKVFMGEYAAQSVDITSPDNRNNLRCALAEAAFLTGIERNSDLVVMSSYAPLLGHVDAWQWRPNLIWCDNLNVFVTPSYYVQQLFSRNLGDEVLAVDLSDPRPADRPHGRIGLATQQAGAEFKDLRIEHDGKLSFDGERLLDPDNMTTFRGRWEGGNGMIRQSQPTDADHALFGDYAWGNCTISLKVRRLAGAGGVALIFRNSEGGSFLQWTLAGRDGKHLLEQHLASHREDDHTVLQAPGEIENDRWYDVKVDLDGDKVRCYLDGKLMHEANIPTPELAHLYAVASRELESGELILKVVNPTDASTEIAISIKGVDGVARQAKLVTLVGDPDDENSFEHPDRVAPRSGELEIAGTDFRHTFPPHSLSVLKINGK